MSAEYEYDLDDRRSKKTVTTTGPEVVTRTLWSGTDELAEYDGAGALLRRVIPGPGIDDKVATIEAQGPNAGAVRYFHTDRLGSVVAVSNGAGAASETYAYSPWGESEAAPTGNPWRYTGRYLDAETGLYYYRARYYSPRLGQFLQTDPIGTKDDPNLYLYVGLDPANLTDPTGRQTFPNLGVAQGINRVRESLAPPDKSGEIARQSQGSPLPATPPVQGPQGTATIAVVETVTTPGGYVRGKAQGVAISSTGEVRPFKTEIEGGSTDVDGNVAIGLQGAVYDTADIDAALGTDALSGSISAAGEGGFFSVGASTGSTPGGTEVSSASATIGVHVGKPGISASVTRETSEVGNKEQKSR